MCVGPVTPAVGDFRSIECDCRSRSSSNVVDSINRVEQFVHFCDACSNAFDNLRFLSNVPCRQSPTSMANLLSAQDTNEPRDQRMIAALPCFEICPSFGEFPPKNPANLSKIQRNGRYRSFSSVCLGRQ